MLKDIWGQKSDEELIAASEHLSEYTKEAEEIIRAELQRRSGIPGPPATIRKNTIDDRIGMDRVKGALMGVGIVAAIIACINLVDAFLIEDSIGRGSEKKQALSLMIELLIVAFAAALGAFFGSISKPKLQASTSGLRESNRGSDSKTATNVGVIEEPTETRESDEEWSRRMQG